MYLIPEHRTVIWDRLVIIRPKELQITHPARALHQAQPVECAIAPCHEVQALDAVLQSGPAELNQISLKLVCKRI